MASKGSLMFEIRDPVATTTKTFTDLDPDYLLVDLEHREQSNPEHKEGIPRGGGCSSGGLQELE